MLLVTGIFGSISGTVSIQVAICFLTNNLKIGWNVHVYTETVCDQKIDCVQTGSSGTEHLPSEGFLV